MLKESKALTYKDADFEISISPMAYIELDKMQPKAENDDELLYYSSPRRG